jgi:hypothetical protein
VLCRHACGKDSCLKVYHEGCLAFKVSDDVMKWICPRHYCDVCGSTIVILACIYCPMSVCENCKGAVATKLDRPRYILLQPLGLFQRATAVASKGNQEVCLIICHTCIDLAERCVDQGKLSPAFFSDLGVEMSFCSDVTFSALTKKRSGVQSFDRMESATTESFITAKASIIKDGVYSETQHSKSMKRRRNNLDERRNEPWSEREVDGVLALLRLYPVRVRGVVQSISESELSDARLKPQVSVLLSRSLEEVREKMEEEFMVEGKAGDLSVKKPVMDTSDLGVMPLSMAIGGVDCLDEDSRIRDETGAVVSRASAVRSGRRKKIAKRGRRANRPLTHSRVETNEVAIELNMKLEEESCMLTDIEALAPIDDTTKNALEEMTEQKEDIETVSMCPASDEDSQSTVTVPAEQDELDEEMGEESRMKEESSTKVISSTLRRGRSSRRRSSE